MTAVAFDSLKTARALESRGFSREQAEAVAEVVADSRAIDLSHLATRDDLKHEIAAVKTDIAAVKHELEQKIDGVKLDIAAAQISTQRFILATVVINAAVVLGAMLGLVKLLGH